MDTCFICNKWMPVSELQRHVNWHLDEDQSRGDQEVARRIAQEEQEVEDTTNQGPDSGFSHGNDHRLTHQAASQEAQMATESGGHDPVADRARYLSPHAWKEFRALTASQEVAPCVLVAEGVMVLLRRCLEGEAQSRVAVSGYVDHYCSIKNDDLGWGCGWRNIQMLASHLLQRDEESKKAIFGGLGAVPEIGCLQKWLEMAWREGFDSIGAQQLGHKVSDTCKWIGTTECAALLRFFGFRARIVDFKTTLTGTGQGGGRRGEEGEGWVSGGEGGNTSGRGQKRVRGEERGGQVGGGMEEDAKQCDECKGAPMTHCDATRPIYDTCQHCMEKKEEKEEKEVKEVKESRKTRRGEEESVGVPLGEGSEGVEEDEFVHHQRVVEWVWDYFTGGKEVEQAPRAASDQMAKQIYCSKKPPLYFQHQGHSRTIVGIERKRGKKAAQEEVFLLVLDPSQVYICSRGGEVGVQKTADLAAALRRGKGWQRLVKREVHTLKKAEYQLCYVEEGLAKGEELQQLKVLESVLHSY